VRPNIIGSDMDFREVRAITDLARAEDWDDIFSAVLARLQDKRENAIRTVSNKLATPSPYLALIGLAGIVGASALVANRRKI
jgi:hypothetical protein